MDIGKLLKNVHSLNEYIAITQDASEKCKTSKIQLNLSAVLALKKIRSLEIEVLVLIVNSLLIANYFYVIINFLLFIECCIILFYSISTKLKKMVLHALYLSGC